MTSKLLTAALKIDELAYNLENISADDSKQIEDYTDTEILSEAKYVLSLFIDPSETHWNAEDLRGENGSKQQVWARGQVRKLKALIAKFGGVAA
jgi:hypothetical protein